MADQKIVQLGPVQADMTPYYMARISCDIFKAALSAPTESQRPWFKYFLYSVSIELGLKASLLNNNNTETQKSKNKTIRHDLTKLREAAEEGLPSGFFSEEEMKTIDMMSPFFANKSLEYLSGDLLMQMLTGGRDLPDIRDLEAVADKVVTYLESQKHFIGSNTEE